MFRYLLQIECFLEFEVFMMIDYVYQGRIQRKLLRC